MKKLYIHVYIYVPIQDVGDFTHTSIRQDFFHLVAELRASHHIPIALVLTGGTPPQSYLSSMMQSQMGFTIRHVAKQPNEKLLQTFWNHTFSIMNTNGGMFFFPSIVQQLGHDYWDHHRSIVQLVQHLQQVLSIVFTKPESYQWLATSFPNDGYATTHSQWQFLLAWFCLGRGERQRPPNTATKNVSRKQTKKQTGTTSASQQSLRRLEQVICLRQQQQHLLHILTILSNTEWLPCPFFIESSITQALSTERSNTNNTNNNNNNNNVYQL